MAVVEIENVSADQPAGFFGLHHAVRIAENATNEKTADGSTMRRLRRPESAKTENWTL